MLYLIDTQQPFTEGDASFLGIVRRYIESVFIVQTKIDLWRMKEGEREAWQAAAQRIVAQAAVHAPGTPVFPLSAREYAEGLLTDDPARFSGGPAQARAPGRRDERGVECAQELAEAALRGERRVVGQ